MAKVSFKKPLVYLSLILFITGCGAPEEESEEVNIDPAPAATVTLTSNSTRVDYDGSVSLSWTTSNVENCVASGNWSGNKDNTGSEVIESLKADSVFDLTCAEVENRVEVASLATAAHKGKPVTATVAVSVDDPGPPTIAMSANPSSVAMNGATTITWNTENTQTCSASGGWSGGKAPSGSQTFTGLNSNTVFQLSCSGPGGSTSNMVSVTVVLPSAPSISLSASPANVAYDGSTVLTWSGNNINSCTASGDWSGNKSASGSQTISNLTSNRSFSLNCSGPGGNTSDTINVTVAAPPVPSISISASPVNVAYDGSTVLTWSGSNIDGCTASGAWSGNKSASGAQTISNLTSDSSFSLSCSGPGGNSSDTVNITVAAPAVPSISLTASPASVAYDGSTTLSWSGAHLTNCVATGAWSGDKAVSGSQTINNLTNNSSFGLSCSGPGGSVNDTVDIVVGAPLDPAVNLTASPSSVAENEPITLSWNSTNADACTASGDWSGNKDLSGTETIASIADDSLFTLVCSGPGGTASNTANVTIVVSNSGTALLSWVPPTENTDGSPLTDLAGYKIYYGTSSGDYPNVVTIDNPGLTSFLVENLGTATWYFVMTSFNTSDIESDYSFEVSKTIN